MVLISIWPNGSMTNWPSEPAAPAMPSAALRFSGGNARPTTPKTMLKPLHDSASPIMTPALRLKSAPLDGLAIQTSPSA